MIDKNAVMEALAKIEDPELRRPLTDLDMIDNVSISDDSVTVDVLLTIAGCPMKKKISEDIRGILRDIKGVENVEINLGVMNDEQKKNLRIKLYGADHAGKTDEQGQPKPVAGDFADRIIAVASGKGGVGKSTTTCNLAFALNKLGYKVGILDADVYGFSVPRIVGLSGQPTAIDDHIVPMLKDGIQVISMGFFVDEETPVIWRGPLLHKAVNQFIVDVLWDKLDFLLVDMPPGTGDVTLTIAQAMPKSEMLVITTPQPVASHTAGRVARLAEKTNLKVLGVVENMSYYDVNGTRDYIFGKDGGKDLAKTLGVPFLGEIPIVTKIREASDQGEPVVNSDDSALGDYYMSIARAVTETKG